MAAVIAAAGLGLLWNRSWGGRTWTTVALRATALLACVLTATAGAAIWVNRQVDFLPTWSALAGGNAVTNSGTVALSTPDTKIGRVLSVVVTGAASKLTMPMYVYLPPGYDQASPKLYPVIEAFHGFPGLPAQWLHGLAAPQILDTEINAGRMSPTVVLFPYQSPKPLLLDTECTNLVGSAQAETFLTKDVPAYAEANYRVRSDQAGWGLTGFSAGAYCATDLLLRHPSQYSAAASLSGYVGPGIKVGNGTENTTYDTVWRLKHLPVPAVALYLTCARSDKWSFRQTSAIAAAAHAPLQVTTSYINGGGHSNQSWKAMEAPAFDWLSSWLGQPTTPS